MTEEQIYEIWAPPGVKWSPWVKPVLFAHLKQVGLPVSESAVTGETPVSLAADIPNNTAVVIDLPGDQGVAIGLQLAGAGHWPIALYNAVPGPTFAGSCMTASSAVDMRALAAAMIAGAETLAAIRPKADMPPAFLLDRRRRIGDNAAGLSPGGFDNRSVSLPSDFPSASMLLSSGIRRAVVMVSPTDAVPQADLSHTLRRWQDAGIDIALMRIGVDTIATPIDVAPPKWYRCAWHAFLVKLGLRPHMLGGFGGLIPIPSAG